MFVENPVFHSRLVSSLQTAIKEIGDRETLQQNFDSHVQAYSSEEVLRPVLESTDRLISNLNLELIRRLDENVNAV